MIKSKQLLSLRRVGFFEGMSFVLLLGIAMPLKYMYGMPIAVSIVGAVHGFLFIWYCIVLILCKGDLGWSLVKTGVLFLASVVPLGPFIAEVWLKQEYQELRATEEHEQEISG